MPPINWHISGKGVAGSSSNMTPPAIRHETVVFIFRAFITVPSITCVRVAIRCRRRRRGGRRSVPPSLRKVAALSRQDQP